VQARKCPRSQEAHINPFDNIGKEAVNQFISFQASKNAASLSQKEALPHIQLPLVSPHGIPPLFQAEWGLFSSSNGDKASESTAELAPEKTNHPIEARKLAAKMLKQDTKTDNEFHTTSVDPPRPARYGHEWVWFLEGYWAERPIANNRLTSSKDSHTMNEVRDDSYRKFQDEIPTQCQGGFPALKYQNTTTTRPRSTSQSKPSNVNERRDKLTKSTRITAGSFINWLHQNPSNILQTELQRGESEGIISKNKKNLRLGLKGPRRKTARVGGRDSFQNTHADDLAVT